MTPHETFMLAPALTINRLLNGLWQVGGAHGDIQPQDALADMKAYHDDGFTTWDLADHYGPAEDFVGQFRPTLSESEQAQAQFFTKWVPRPMMMTRSIVENAVNISRKRMNMPTLDLLQFHWWEYRDTRYLDALKFLHDLQNEGKIRYLALTNFDTEHTAKIVQASIPIVSNQVQYSLIDRRPEAKMIPYCQQHHINLLTYGTFCGGLLSEKYLNTPEPSKLALTTASLRKYKNMIDVWGGWGLFQELLSTLKTIANQHNVSLANVAVRYILDKPAVAGVIVGARLGVSEHRTDNARVFGLKLTPQDLQDIEAVCAKSNDLLRAIGDCGDEYRQ